MERRVFLPQLSGLHCNFLQPLGDAQSCWQLPAKMVAQGNGSSNMLVIHVLVKKCQWGPPFPL